VLRLCSVCWVSGQYVLLILIHISVTVYSLCALFCYMFRVTSLLVLLCVIDHIFAFCLVLSLSFISSEKRSLLTYSIVACDVLAVLACKEQF